MFFRPPPTVVISNKSPGIADLNTEATRSFGALGRSDIRGGGKFTDSSTRFVIALFDVTPSLLDIEFDGPVKIDFVVFTLKFFFLLFMLLLFKNDVNDEDDRRKELAERRGALKRSFSFSRSRRRRRNNSCWFDHRERRRQR